MFRLTEHCNMTIAVVFDVRIKPPPKKKTSQTCFMPNFSILASLCSLVDLRVNIGAENVEAYFSLFQSPESRSSFHVGCGAP